MPGRLPFCLLVVVATLLMPSFAKAQTAYFADGYHGGVYGHYPPTFTQYIVDGLRANPDWKLNLEIEPETWDFAQTNTPEAYRAFQEFADDPSTNNRLEFVNPAYAQSYLWNISGESVLQQLDRGMRKIREHFPHATFPAYSSEEPCFTSALPGILKSFGFKYAVLKNPNTCWGGYTRPFGGELVNWIGPDGTAITTVPRYAIEGRNPASTWETIANANSPAFIQAAQAAGIKHPVGMCYQDAGWRFGPWLNHVGIFYQPTQSILWRDYFENLADSANAPNWRLSQEDVQVSLVWGSQTLQRIAQQVRRAENRVVMAEKMATLAGVFARSPWPGGTLDEAWRTLLLSQHHDCWIVPYNLHGKTTWAGLVARWTAATHDRSDNVISSALSALAPAQTNEPGFYLRVFNTLGDSRTDLVTADLPADWDGSSVKISDGQGRRIPSQPVSEAGSPVRQIIFRPTIPPLGYGTYRLEKASDQPPANPAAVSQANGLFTLESDDYKITLDPQRGGVIKSLLARKLGDRELVDTASAREFNEVRGYFFEPGQYFSTADHPAKIEVLEKGPLRTRVLITSELVSNAVTQTITLTHGEPRIDFSVRIDWQSSPGIGADFQQSGGYDARQDRKAFYDERRKLQVLFPLNLPHQEVFKDAPFDVVASRLTNTFFENWSAIKNDEILNWVDVFDQTQDVGAALLTDHTTSYGHGLDAPLSLTLQYSGIGLWGRHCTLNGPTEVHYALLPHAGNWEQSRLWTTSKAWNEPLIATVFPSSSPVKPTQSLLEIKGGGWEIPTARLVSGQIVARLFNPSASESRRTIHYGAGISRVELVQLDGRVINEIPLANHSPGGTDFQLALPAFGIATLRLTP